MATAKQNILTALVALGEGLRASLGLRAAVGLISDPLQYSDPLPSLQLWAGNEIEVGKDYRGRTYRFPVTFKFCFEAQREPQAHGETYAAAVQTAIESDLSLGDLVINMDSQDSEYIGSSVNSPVNYQLITYQVEYRRLRGDPDTQY